MPGGDESARRAARLPRKIRLSATWVLALCSACSWFAPVFAAQIDFGVGLTSTYESNAFRTEDGAQPELYNSFIAATNITENNRDLNARALIQIEHRHFSQNTFSDDTTAFLDGAAVWTITPQRLNWVLTDTFREVQLNLTTPDIPTNRTKSNTLDTGPNLTLALNPADSIVLSARYGRFDVQESPSDNHRYGGAVRGLHLLSPGNTLSLNYEVARVYFDPQATTFPVALQQNAYGRVDILQAGSGLTADFGQTRVTQYGGPQEQGRLARLTLIKAFSLQTSLRLAYSDQISDPYTDLLRGVTLSGIPIDPAVVILQSLAPGDFYHSKLASIALVNQGDRLQYTLVALGRKIDFQTLDEDYDERGGRIFVAWIYSGALSFLSYGNYSRRTYVTLDRVDVDRDTSLIAHYKVNSRLAISFTGNLIWRNSTEPGQSFVDRRAMVVVGYTFGTQFEIQSRR
jgi:hypothetical protein